MKKHNYEVQIEWTGNEGSGTSGYATYNRNHTIMAPGKYTGILGSSDPDFLGEQMRYNPEDMFLSSVASCHMLWFLHLCSVNKIVVTAYEDNAKGTMAENANGSGQFTGITLYPKVTITNQAQIELANSLHAEANKMCFIANSCNFTVAHQPVTVAEIALDKKMA